MTVWIGIHIVILIAYFAGFLSSVGGFQKLGEKIYRWMEKHKKAVQPSVIQNIRILHPTENTEKLTESFFVQKIASALQILFIGNLLGLVLSLTALSDGVITQGNLISRNPYGEGEKEVELLATCGEEKLEKTIPVTISERQYTEEEIQDIFEIITARLEKAVLGKNETLSVVCYDLDLVTKLPEYPVEISWKLDHYDAMDSTGRLQIEGLKPEGTPILLTAVLNYFEFQGEHSFYVMVYPPPKTPADKLYDQIKLELERYQKETVHYQDMILPDTLNGNKIAFQTPVDHSGNLLFLLFVAAAFLVYIGKDKDVEKEVKKREQEMLRDYPEMVSKMALLLGAGMTIKGAFEKIAFEYERHKKQMGFHYVYEEMLIGVHQMQGGVAEGEVYNRFGERCHIQRFIKLGALLSQNLRKGNSAILQLMEAEERDALEDRKSFAKRRGEEAGTKLLLPMGMMLVIVMIIVILPAFLSFRI